MSSRYSAVSRFGRLIFSRMRSTASARNAPTPTATDTISTRLGIEGTCWASTCRSGSASVTITPITNAMSSTVGSLRALAVCAPTPSPSGVIAISEPS